MSNVELANAVLQSLWNFGVREVVLCAGARNAPFVACLAQPGPLKVHSFFEERSAAFFALGRMQATACPVAVLTTSGTAAAELLPATIEANYQGLPLILITADRPRAYRGSGAPQSINQIGIYSHYVERSWDIEGQWSESLQSEGLRPLHLNVCFDEPLIDAAVAMFSPRNVIDQSVNPAPTPAALTAANVSIATAMRAPLVIVGALPSALAQQVLPWLKICGRPLYLETASNLRGHPDLQQWEWTGGDRSLALADFDGVIRIGGVPTLRLWRDLEKASLPVLHFSHLPFSGLPRAREVLPLSALTQLAPQFLKWSGQESARPAADKLESSLREFPASEAGWVRWLSESLPSDARLFLGNSLPIREWDLVATRCSRAEVFVNRGTNGIDGLISTFLGVASTEHSNWAVIGDLSAMYDLSGPWAARELGIRDISLVILNNGGGKIFKNIFNNPLFENRHDLGFAAWAKMWGWDYERLESPRSLAKAVRPRVIEIVPNELQSEAFWEAYK